MSRLPALLAFEVCPESNYSLHFSHGQGAAMAWRLTARLYGGFHWRNQAVGMARP